MSKIYDSEYQIQQSILTKLGGDGTKCFDSQYSILLEILDKIEGGGGTGGANIDDNTISTTTTWSSSKIVSELDDYATIENVNVGLATKANTSDLDTYIKFTSLSQTDYNLLPAKDVSTLYLTNVGNVNYVYIGNILIGGSNAVEVSPSRLQYITTDSQILWPTTLTALPSIIRNTYGSIFEYGAIEFASYAQPISSIGNNGFFGSQRLSRFIIPNTIDNIGNNAFLDCSQLVYIDLGSGIKTIGSQAFSNTALTEITFPSSLTTIGQLAFANCSSLSNISYSGTMSDWETITKNAGWYNNVPATVVHCSDGDVAI